MKDCPLSEGLSAKFERTVLKTAAIWKDSENNLRGKYKESQLRRLSLLLGYSIIAVRSLISELGTLNNKHY